MASSRSTARSRSQDDGTVDRDRRHVLARAGPRDRVLDDRRRAARRPDGRRSRSCSPTPRSSRAARARWARARCRSAARRCYKASEEVLAKAKRLAAHLLEANVDDIVLHDGGSRRRRRAGHRPDVGRARAGRERPGTAPDDWTADGASEALASELDFNQGEATYPFGAHIAVVEVDTETGRGRATCDTSRSTTAAASSTRCSSRASSTAGSRRASRRRSTKASSTTTTATRSPANLMDYAMPSAAELPSSRRATPRRRRR